MKKILVLMLTLIVSITFLFSGNAHVNARPIGLGDPDGPIEVVEELPIEYVSAPIGSNLVYWDFTLSDYNCYGFAIGERDSLHPGYMSGSTSPDFTIDAMALDVIDDLTDLGYGNPREVTSSYVPTSDEFMIAFRVGFFNYENSEDGLWDYHFAKYDSQSAKWLHKPGGSAILEFKTTADLQSDWILEYYKEYTDSSNGADGWYRNNVDKYDSDITYIVYSAPHGVEAISSTTQNEASYHVSPGSAYSSYAYAIEESGNLIPGYSFRTWKASDGLYGMKSRVIIDLQDLGYEDIREVNSYYRPTSSDEKLIAFRLGSERNYDSTYGIFTSTTTYHFLKYNQSSINWYHMFQGGTSAIRLQSQNYITQDWIGEYYLSSSNSWQLDNDVTYDGTIVYIAYRTGGPGSVTY